MGSMYVRPDAENHGVCVALKPGEDTAILVKRFKKKFMKSGILQEYRQRMYYQKPSEKKRRKRRETIRRKKRETIKLEKLKKS